MRNAKHPIRKDVEDVRYAKMEILKAKTVIIRLQKEQESRFTSLSKESQKMLCRVPGLEYLECFQSTIEETLPLAGPQRAPDDHQEVLPDETTIFQNMNYQPESLRGVQYEPQAPEMGTKTSKYGNDAFKADDEQGFTRWSIADIVQMAPQRNEAFQGMVIYPPLYNSSQQPHQRNSWWLGDAQGQQRPPPPPLLGSGRDVLAVEGMLKTHQEQQRMGERLTWSRTDARRAEEGRDGEYRRDIAGLAASAEAKAVEPLSYVSAGSGALEIEKMLRLNRERQWVLKDDLRRLGEAIGMAEGTAEPGWR